jgi:hypothetical protein
MPPSILLGQRLVLFRYLLQQFGFRSFEELRQKYRDIELESSTPDNSLFYQNLVSQIKFPSDRLKEYDENLIAHLGSVNQSRAEPIRLKYYQYFSLLFTEHYLDEYIGDKHALAESLNEFIASSSQSGIKNLPPYTEEDLNKVAYWNATGSGKTFIAHINVLQWINYAKKARRNFRNLLLLTPSEDLSRQHLDALEESGVGAHYYWEDKESGLVKVIDIHKIREFSTGEGVTIPLAEFEQNNAIFVDEGHKGDSKEDSQWRNVRDTLSHDGFAFEYSATFGQMNDEALQEEYAKCIIFDYSYGNFYRDGYGKDYWIHNLSDDVTGAREKRYLLQNLLLFLQQKLYYESRRNEIEPYRIENPLLIFVGTSVEPKAKGTVADENKEVISDVKKVLDFFNDFFRRRDQYIGWIDDLIQNKRLALFKEDYRPRFEYLFKELPDAEAVYQLCSRALFHSASPDVIELYTLRNAEGEIAVKVKNADHYFALIYIGDTSSFKTPLEGEYEFKRDVITPSLFHSLSDAQKNPVNILIGARKFIEGWNNYRGSSIGLINFGRSRGSQIIQLFGRGVRLMGKSNSLKRSANTGEAPKGMEIVETLNVFGLRADYMKRFKEDLEREGIKTVKKQILLDIKVRDDLNQLKLFTLERNPGMLPFDTTEVFELRFEKSIHIRLDIAPRKFLALAGREELITDVDTTSFRFTEEELVVVNWEEAYLRLMTYKRDRQYFNLHINHNTLRELFDSIDYQIISDQKVVIGSIEDIERIRKLILEIFKRYVDTFYRRSLRDYESKQLRLAVLTEKNSNLAGMRWQLEVITTDPTGDELQGIRALLGKIEELAAAGAAYPGNLKENQFLLNTWVDAHVYQPLLQEETRQKYFELNGKQTLERIIPPGLNDGERVFVEHLRSFVKGQSGRYPGYDFYLLRNLSRGHGFGFYFMAGGFYPDFMLWLKEKSGSKQYLSFIDPHGLRNEQNGWKSTKIMMHKSIKEEIETKIGDPNLILSSFILQPGEGFEGAGVHRWSREDDPKHELKIQDYAGRKNVFEIPKDGNKSGPGSYIDLIVQKIVQGAEGENEIQ